MKTIRNVLTLVTLLSVSACASSPSDAPVYNRAPYPDSGSSHLYIYRLGAYPKLRTPSVFVDGKLVFDPPEQTYTLVTLPVGVHIVKIDWAADTGWPDLQFPITLHDRVALYLKITGSFENLGTKYRLGSRVFPMSQDEAEKELRQCCRYVAPEK